RPVRRVGGVAIDNLLHRPGGKLAVVALGQDREIRRRCFQGFRGWSVAASADAVTLRAIRLERGGPADLVDRLDRLPLDLRLRVHADGEQQRGYSSGPDCLGHGTLRSHSAAGIPAVAGTG